MMKTYRVWAKCVSFCFIDVEANSEEEAWELAKDADGGEFEDDPTSGYW